jgi:hypothetical protein
LKIENCPGPGAVFFCAEVGETLVFRITILKERFFLKFLFYGKRIIGKATRKKSVAIQKVKFKEGRSLIKAKYIERSTEHYNQVQKFAI